MLKEIKGTNKNMRKVRNDKNNQEALKYNQRKILDFNNPITEMKKKYRCEKEDWRHLREKFWKVDPSKCTHSAGQKEIWKT